MQFHIKNFRQTEATFPAGSFSLTQLPTEPRLRSLPGAGSRGRAGREPPCSGDIAPITTGTPAGTLLLGLQKPFPLVFILVCFLGFLPSSITFLSRILLPRCPPPKALSNLLAASRAEQPSGARGASNTEHPAPKQRLRFTSLLTLQARYKPPPATCLTIPNGFTEQERTVPAELPGTHNNPGSLLSVLKAVRVLSTRTATHQNAGHCHEVGVSLSSRVEAKPQALIPGKEAAHRTITEGGRPRLPPFGGSLSGLLPRRGFWLEGPGPVQALSCGRVTSVTQKPASPADAQGSCCTRSSPNRAARTRFWCTRLRSVSCVLVIIFAGFWFWTVRKYII